ncbi:hypothetical protein NBO_66g0004 [Nosema bombycis CQ1]|uniref:Uncharacterized protein n=1 Tax=Nosema bombycis (strain CQ1 / CVCC 102059) TaxID=578461 RepID=R0M6C4_NOSB1|nr:hypothetical protein NBO_66g0004 [Nosema bombycis CQ1]|eukprot:EOB13544.1 hypothetical protein NBO_66g0004 [Nosema bombycis CQ1]
MQCFGLVYALKTILFKNIVLCSELNDIPATFENLQCNQIKQEDVLFCLKSKLNEIKLREDYFDDKKNNDLQLNTSEISEKNNSETKNNSEDASCTNLFVVFEEENDSMNAEVDSDSYDKSSVIRDEEDYDTFDVKKENKINQQVWSLQHYLNC